MVVHSALEAFAGGANSGRRRLIVEALGPGKDPGHGQVAGAMLKLDVHRVVVAIAVPVAVDVEPVEVRIRQPARLGAWGLSQVDECAGCILRLAERQAGGRNAEGLRDSTPVPEME